MSEKETLKSASENEKETVNSTPEAEKKTKGKAKKGRLKAFFKSSKTKHGTVALAITAVVLVIVVLLNIVCGLLTERFPNIKLDFTSNRAYELQQDTIDYMAHLKKDVTLNILTTKKEFESNGSYFVQAENLLEKMQSESNGKLKLNYVDTTANPNFTSKYPNVDWTSGDNIAIVECGEQYKALTLDECFEYNEESYYYYGSYDFTGTKIEQAVVAAILNVTTEDKVVVDVITGNQEQDSSYITTLLTNNAYQVNEVSLATGALDDDAKFVLLYAPSVDLDEGAVEKLSDWLTNNGKYGRTLLYAPPAEYVETPNIDALLDEWGLKMNEGYVYETDSDHTLYGGTAYIFITDYTDYYTKKLKNSNIPVATNYAANIEITDSEKAHSILNTSSKSCVIPYSLDLSSFESEDEFKTWINDNMSGEPLSVAAESVQSNSNKDESRIIAFGSYSMLSQVFMSMNSFNNSAYFMNIMNTISDKDDDTVTIDSKTLDSQELGVTDSTIPVVMMWIFVIVIPIGTLVVGIVIWLRRRNR